MKIEKNWNGMNHSLSIKNHHYYVDEESVDKMSFAKLCKHYMIQVSNVQIYKPR